MFTPLQSLQFFEDFRQLRLQAAEPLVICNGRVEFCKQLVAALQALAIFLVILYGFLGFCFDSFNFHLQLLTVAADDVAVNIGELAILLHDVYLTAAVDVDFNTPTVIPAPSATDCKKFSIFFLSI